MKILTCFGFNDIHNQQDMLDYSARERKSLIAVIKSVIDEFKSADVALVGGNNMILAISVRRKTNLILEILEAKNCIMRWIN